MSILVSVVVPTFRRPQLLERCLQALLAQTFPSQAYEIIIVDDAPEETATRTLVMEWQQRLQSNYVFLAPPVVAQIPVTSSGINGDQKVGTRASAALQKNTLGKNEQENWLKETPGQKRPVDTQDQGIPIAYQVNLHPDTARFPRLVYLPAALTQGPAAARNIGWRAARGEIIAFTDDDCMPEPDWLMNGISAFEDGVAGVSGRLIVPVPPCPTDHELNTAGLERSDFITANCFYRRKVLEEVGGFDERFAQAWREDSDLYFTIRERNYPLAWASGAIVVHPVRPEAWGSSLRHQRKSFYNALLYKKHPKLYWRYIQPAPPWLYYSILAALVVGILGLLVKNPLLTIIGWGACALMIARFCYRRLRKTSHSLSHVTEMVLTSLFIPFLSIYWRLRGALHWRIFFL